MLLPTCHVRNYSVCVCVSEGEGERERERETGQRGMMHVMWIAGGSKSLGGGSSSKESCKGL